MQNYRKSIDDDNKIESSFFLRYQFNAKIDGRKSQMQLYLFAERSVC